MSLVRRLLSDLSVYVPVRLELPILTGTCLFNGSGTTRYFDDPRRPQIATDENATGLKCDTSGKQPIILVRLRLAAALRHCQQPIDLVSRSHSLQMIRMILSIGRYGVATSSPSSYASPASLRRHWALF